MDELLSQLATVAQILAIPIAIVAVAVAIFVYRRSKQHRALACTFDPLLVPIEIKAGEALRGDIEILHRGNPVANIYVARANVRNTGNLPIRKDDIVEPLTFSLREGSQLLREPTVISSKPGDLSINWTYGHADTELRITETMARFDLLNPEDEFVVELTYSGVGELPAVGARIVGVNTVEQLELEVVRLKKQIQSALMLGIPILAISIILSLVFEPDTVANSLLPFAIGAGMAICLQAVSPALRLRRHRKAKNRREATLQRET